MNIYHLIDLKIVKYNTDEYYMCEYKDDKYTEIFSSKILDKNNFIDEENLSNYYSPLEILSGLYTGTLDSLFQKYNSILKNKLILDYESNNNLDSNCLFDEEDDKHLRTINKLYCIEFSNFDGIKNYICKYNTLSSSFIEIFTGKKVNDKYLVDIIPLKRCNINYNYINSNEKISKFNLLKIYYELNKINIIREYKEKKLKENSKKNVKFQLQKKYINRRNND